MSSSGAFTTSRIRIDTPSFFAMAWNDSLDDFERQLAAEKRREAEEGHKDRHRHARREHHRHQHSHREHGHGHGSSRHRDREEEGEQHNGDDGHRRKRRRRSREREDGEREEERERRRRDRRERRGDDNGHRRTRDDEGDGVVRDEEQAETSAAGPPAAASASLKRDAWMEAPSALEVEYKHKSAVQQSTLPGSRSPRAQIDLKIHEAELNKHHLQELAEGRAELDDPTVAKLPASHEVDYEFGDSGSKWRMTRLKNLYRTAEENAQDVEELALKQYGSLRAFDDAREEEIELDRRDRYGEGYVGKIKPSGELFQERKLDANIHRAQGDRGHIESSGAMGDQTENQAMASGQSLRIQTLDQPEPPSRSVALDPTALNRMRAKMMKAKLKGLPEADQLEREYEEASRTAQAGAQDGVVVLSTMDNRMLAGGRKGEVKDVDNRRGRERGNVEENDEMSIDDMVREERRTKGLFGNKGSRLAERIAKDATFDDNLDYMDENATKLARRVHKSDAALRSSAIANHQLTNTALASCPLCHHEDRPSDPLPTAPTVSMGHRTYLTLATTPAISPHGSVIIVPVAHHSNLLHCDDDEWEELRNFQKSLVRMYHARDLGVLFYENAARPGKQRHAALVAVAVPLGLADDAPAFFREAILAADDEWTQHRKLIHTTGKGKSGFRKTLSKDVPYFHVWTELDGGLGHVVEDDRRWPQGDLFAREVLGGMLSVRPEVWRKQGRWERGAETAARVEKFRKGWRAFDWTRMLVEGGEAV